MQLKFITTFPLSPPTVYGYGFLMVCLVSLASLLGILVVPLLKNNSEGDKQSRRILVYKYAYSLLIALGISALLCDAILHLLPHVRVTSLIK